MLGTGITLLGRAEDNDVVLADIGVSRRHARILVQSKGVAIEDMGSGNGVYFQGRRCHRQMLKNGDEILVDPFTLRFRMHEEDTENDGITAELEDVDDDDTVRVALRSSRAHETEERPALAAPLGQLVTLVGQRLHDQYTIDGSLTLGRSEAQNVILFDPAASRNHAVIEYLGGDFWLRDDGSANGTFVNSSRIREQCLRDGDRVRIGGTEFRFEIHPATAAAGWMREQKTRVRGEIQLGSVPHGTTGRSGDSDPSVYHPVRLALMAGLGGFMVVVMMLLGAVIGLEMMGEDGQFWSEEVAAPIDPQTTGLDPNVQSRVDFLMNKGAVDYEAGRFLEAASQYYKVLKDVPNHKEAVRNGFTACEQLMIETMRRGLLLRNLSEPAKKSKRSEALKAAKLALNGRGDMALAFLLLREVAVFAPEDVKVLSALEALETRRAVGG